MKKILLVSLLKSILLIAVTLPALGKPQDVEVISAAAPSYPSTDGVAEGSGEVKVEIEIGPLGKVVRAKATSGSTNLRLVAEAAARQWLFKATNRKITRWPITFRFIIRGDLAEPPAVATVFTLPDRIDIIAMGGKAESNVDPPLHQSKPSKAQHK